MTSNQAIRWVLKPTVFLAALIPFGLLVRGLLTGDLGADPLKAITTDTGDWALRFLVITLGVTPLRRLTKWNGAVRFRRMVGLFAFFYATLHLLIFIVADRLAGLGFPSLAAWQTIRDLAVSIGGEIYKRPYITVGFISWVCLLALASTSTAGIIRRLGGKRWQRLHRLIYVAAIAGVLHFWWSVKVDPRGPETYAVAVVALLVFRIVWWVRARLSVPVGPARRAAASGR